MKSEMVSYDKYLEYGDMFRMADEFVIPISVTIELSTKCNLKCEHCYIPNHGNSELSFDAIDNIFRDLREMGTYELVLTGGEVFARNDCIEIIELARNYGFHIIIFSNATLISDNIAERLEKLHIGLFSTTIFSMDEEIHDKITGVKGSLKKALAGISLLKQHHIPVEIKTIVMQKNWHTLQGVNNFCRENEFHHIATPYVFARSDGDQEPLDYRLTFDQLVEIMPLIDKIVNFNPLVRTEDNYMCPSFYHSFGIEASGNVNACNSLFYSVGNIYESTIREIWLSKKFQGLRKIKFKHLKSCKGCELSSYCIRCAGIAYGETNSMIEKFDFACQVALARFLVHSNK